MNRQREIHYATPDGRDGKVEAVCGRLVYGAFTTLIPICATCKDCVAWIASCREPETV